MLSLQNYLYEKGNLPVAKVDVTNVPFSEAEKIKNADESIKKFLPSVWNEFAGTWQMTLFPILTNEWDKETKLFIKDTSGLKGTVYENKLVTPNAYTLPAVKNKARSQFFFIPLLPIVMSYYMYALFKLSDQPIKGRRSGNKVSFTGPKDIDICMWETKGFHSLVPEENLRKAVMMHEIGHWVEYEPFIVSGMFRLAQLIPPIAIPMFVMSVIYGRSAEWKADRFAAKMGYRDELKLALSRLGYHRRTNASLFVKVNDVIRVAFTKIHNVVDKFLPITTHPSIKKRTTALQEALMLNQLTEEQYITELVKLGVLEEDVKDVFNMMSKQLFNPIDKLLGRSIKLLFPLNR